MTKRWMALAAVIALASTVELRADQPTPRRGVMEIVPAESPPARFRWIGRPRTVQPVVTTEAGHAETVVEPAKSAPACSHCRPRGAFVIGDTRFEPTLRDIRLVRPPLTLPGRDSGIVETLPVLPPRRGGYFLLPAW